MNKEIRRRMQGKIGVIGDGKEIKGSRKDDFS